MSVESSLDWPAPRSLGLHGARNFRDLGGYRGLDGRRMRVGRIFRSSHLEDLTAADREIVGRLGLLTVCDLRGASERNRQGAPALPNVQYLQGCAIEPSILRKLQGLQEDGAPLDAAATSRIMIDVYEDYIRSWSSSYRVLFDVLLEDGAPLVFHCAAGKDRTGIAAALVLSALGVPRPTVRHDYLLSRQFWREPSHVHSDFPGDVVRVAGSVDERFIDAAFAVIDSECGGLESYLEDRMDLGPSQRRRLAALYLDPAAVAAG